MSNLHGLKDHSIQDFINLKIKNKIHFNKLKNSIYEDLKNNNYFLADSSKIDQQEKDYVISFLCSKDNKSNEKQQVRMYFTDQESFNAEQVYKDFINSVKKWQKFSSPFVCKILDQFESDREITSRDIDDKRFYIVYEHQESYSLTQLLTQKLRFNEFEEKKSEFPEDFVKLVFRQLLSGLAHIHSFDLVLGFIDNDNVLISNKGLIDAKVGAKLINKHFNRRLDMINKDQRELKHLHFDFLPPELLPLDLDGSRLDQLHTTDNQSIAVCLYTMVCYKETERYSFPFDGEALSQNMAVRANKLAKKINTNRPNLFDKSIDFKDFIDTQLDPRPKRREDRAVDHAYFDQVLQPITKHVEYRVDSDNHRIIFHKKEAYTHEDQRLGTDDSDVNKDQQIFDFVFRKYLFRKYNISNLDEIRNKFVDLDSDISGYIELKDFENKVEKMQMDKITKIFHNYIKQCERYDQDAYVSSLANQTNLEVFDFITDIYQSISKKMGPTLSDIEVFKWIVDKFNIKKIRSRDETGKQTETDFDFHFFKNDQVRLKTTTPFNGSHFKFNIKTMSQPQGFTLLEFGRIYFDVFFEDSQVNKMVAKCYRDVLLDGFKKFIFKNKDSTKIEELKIFFHESNMRQSNEAIRACLFRMFLYPKLKPIIAKFRKENDMHHHHRLSTRNNETQADQNLWNNNQKNEMFKNHNAIDYVDFRKLMEDYNFQIINLQDILAFQMIVQDLIKTHFEYSEVVAKKCRIDDNKITVTHNLEQYQQIVMKPFLDHNVSYFCFRIKLNRYNNDNFGSYLALLDDTDKLQGLNFTGTTYNLKETEEFANLSGLKSLNDGDQADLLWTVRPKKSDEDTDTEKNHKVLTITFSSSNVKIAQFKQEPMDESRKQKLVLSMMMAHDQFTILMM